MKSMITNDYYLMLPLRRSCEAAKYMVTLPWVILSNCIAAMQNQPQHLQRSVHVS